MKALRFFIITAFLMLLSAPAIAQSKEFNALRQDLQRLNDEYKKAYDAKDYTTTIAKLNETERMIEKYQSENKESLENNNKEMAFMLKYALNNTYYNLACSYSLSGKSKLAVDAFAKAVAVGYNDYRHVLVDKDLDNIRPDKKFRSLLNSIKKYDKLEILKAAAPYQRGRADTLPTFTYAQADNRSLQAVKEYFNLDSVAGHGDEISRMLNVLHFVHNEVSHDGGFNPFCEKDAIDMYNYAKVNKRGINCRCLAIMLSEMYLALGMPARYITCLPADPNDNDCHVIVSVWSRDKGKWLWMDPTFDAYVQDDKGNYLSIQEVRERLIKGLPLVLNEDANWNHKSKQSKEEYIESYMAKNLYWLECPVNSTFNVESPYRATGSEYVDLVPSGFTSRAVYQRYRTSDDAYFWQAPK